ncbi:hypothetical protein [Vibrio fortis]|uniref:hypothetical protein n=1 Tax=Vibrio fortis TaxID=212667 RepID=UPI0038CDB3F4
MNKFCKSYFEVFSAIELCLDQKLLMPSLSLIYAAIDSLAWVAYGDLAVGKRYQKWINNYMYRDNVLEANAIDLYAARCAILHTLTPDSDLSEQKKARVVTYAWGDSDVEQLKIAIDRFSDTEYVAIHVNDLLDSLKQGVVLFMEELPSDLEALERSNKHFGSLSTNELNMAIGK